MSWIKNILMFNKKTECDKNPIKPPLLSIIEIYNLIDNLNSRLLSTQQHRRFSIIKINLDHHSNDIVVESGETLTVLLMSYDHSTHNGLSCFVMDINGGWGSEVKFIRSQLTNMLPKKILECHKIYTSWEY